MANSLQFLNRILRENLLHVRDLCNDLTHLRHLKLDSRIIHETADFIALQQEIHAAAFETRMKIFEHLKQVVCREGDRFSVEGLDACHPWVPIESSTHSSASNGSLGNNHSSVYQSSTSLRSKGNSIASSLSLGTSSNGTNSVILDDLSVKFRRMGMVDAVVNHGGSSALVTVGGSIGLDGGQPSLSYAERAIIRVQYTTPSSQFSLGAVEGCSSASLFESLISAPLSDILIDTPFTDKLPKVCVLRSRGRFHGP